MQVGASRTSACQMYAVESQATQATRLPEKSADSFHNQIQRGATPTFRLFLLLPSFTEEDGGSIAGAALYTIRDLSPAREMIEGATVAAAAATGVVVGKHLGAIIGTMIEPGIGTAVGTVVGEILGGVGGAAAGAGWNVVTRPR